LEHDVKEIAAQGIKCYKNQGKAEVIAGQAMTSGRFVFGTQWEGNHSAWELLCCKD